MQHIVVKVTVESFIKITFMDKIPFIFFYKPILIFLNSIIKTYFVLRILPDRKC